MRLTLLIVFFLLFASCIETGRESISSEDPERIYVNLDEAKPLYMSDYFSGLEYIPLQAPEDRPIGRIRKFLIQEPYLGFFDQARNSIWVYTFEGNYVNEVGIPRGRGPGELENIEDVILTREGEIHALGVFKIVVYDLDGTFISETAFNFWIYRFEYNPSSEEYIGYPSNALNRALNNEHTAHNLIYFDKEGRITKSFLPIENGREELGFMTPNKFPSFQPHQLFFPHLVDTVYTVGPSGVAPRYILDYGKYSIPEEVFDRRKDYRPTPEGRIEFIEKELEANNYVNYLTFFNETDLYIHFWILAGGNPYTVLYNKETKETEVGSGRLLNDIDYGFVPFIYESSDEALYTVIEAHDMLRHLNHIYENEPEKYADPKMRPLIDLVHSLDDNSNPILQIATFKTGE